MAAAAVPNVGRRGGQQQRQRRGSGEPLIVDIATDEREDLEAAFEAMESELTPQPPRQQQQRRQPQQQRGEGQERRGGSGPRVADVFGGSYISRDGEDPFMKARAMALKRPRYLPPEVAPEDQELMEQKFQLDQGLQGRGRGRGSGGKGPSDSSGRRPPRRGTDSGLP